MAKATDGDAGAGDVDEDGGEPPAGGNPFRERGVFVSGIGVGLLLVVVSLALSAVGITRPIFQTLVLCAGLGIILGAFGSLATAKLPLAGATVGGVGALALILSTFVINNSTSGYVSIKVVGDVSGTEMSLRGDTMYYSRRAAPNEHEFIILGDTIVAQTLRLEVVDVRAGGGPGAGNGGDDGDSGDGSDGDRLLTFGCISRDDLRDKLGTGETVEWTLDRGHLRLFRTGSNQDVSKPNDLGCFDAPAAPDVPAIADAGPAAAATGNDVVRTAGWPWPVSLVGPAHAEEPAPVDIRGLVEDLKTQSYTVKTAAREQLGAYGVDGVRAILDILLTETSDDVRFGALGSLVTIMRDNAKALDQIRDAVKDDDLRRLVRMLADPNQAIRYKSSEVLFLLQAQATLDIAAEILPELDEVGQNNVLAVTLLVGQKMSPELRKAIAPRYERLQGPDGKDDGTRAVADRLVRSLKE